MDFDKLAIDFIKYFQGVGYQSHSQVIAVKAFATWLKKNIVSDKCVACDGRGWFGSQFCEGEECLVCEGTGIKK